MTSSGRVLNETRQHQPGQPVLNFTISLPQTVDVCSLRVRISAGNSAGMSAPSEAADVGKHYYPHLNYWIIILCYFFTIVCSSARTDTTTTASSAANTSTGSGGNTQQEDSTTIIGEVYSIEGYCMSYC